MLNFETSLRQWSPHPRSPSPKERGQCAVVLCGGCKENCELGTSCKLATAGGNYFRIEDTNISGKNKYLDLEGNIPNNKTLENGKQTGRSKEEYRQVTHFNIE